MKSIAWNIWREMGKYEKHLNFPCSQGSIRYHIQKCALNMKWYRIGLNPIAPKNSQLIQSFVAKSKQFCSKFLKWRSSQVEDEDHDDLHLDFPDFKKNVQKSQSSIAFESSSHVHQISMNKSCKNIKTNSDPRKSFQHVKCSNIHN